ncbi:hypothetical protein VNO77_44205 [Canavalia gladiata]|uniref:Uncharacterized protein n=1 Tax=Canavalia gladiata TaxID=3824 RepID=A0AAN9JWM5_CANGL
MEHGSHGLREAWLMWLGRWLVMAWNHYQRIHDSLDVPGLIMLKRTKYQAPNPVARIVIPCTKLDDFSFDFWLSKITHSSSYFHMSSKVSAKLCSVAMTLTRIFKTLPTQTNDASFSVGSCGIYRTSMVFTQALVDQNSSSLRSTQARARESNPSPGVSQGAKLYHWLVLKQPGQYNRIEISNSHLEISGLSVWEHEQNQDQHPGPRFQFRDLSLLLWLDPCSFL